MINITNIKWENKIIKCYNKKKLANQLEKQIKEYELSKLKNKILNNIDYLVEDYDFMTKTTAFGLWHAKNNKKYLLKNITKSILKK